MKISGPLGLLFLFLWLAALPAGVSRGDGFFVPRTESTRPGPDGVAARVKASYIDEPEQQAVLHFDGQQETLYLSVRYEGEVSEFGWIVPVPTCPEVELAAPGLVQDIANFEHRVSLEGWKDNRFVRVNGGVFSLGGGASGDSGSVTQGPRPRLVDVVERKRLGLFDVTVLRASEPNALSEWLQEHSFEAPKTDEALAILRYYVEADMYFCAVRVVAGAASKSKWLTPLTLKFSVKQPFFPLQVSAIHARPEVTSKVVVHAFLPLDELSFSGTQRIGHGDFEQKERLFRAHDLPLCVKTFPNLRTEAYTLVTFEAKELGGVDMRDLWVATTETQAHLAEAERRWYAVSDESRTPYHLRLCSVDFPGTPWGLKAQAALEKLGGEDRLESAQKILDEGVGDAAARRNRDAMSSYRRALKVAPELAERVAELEQELAVNEEAFLEATWQAMIRAKQEAIETRDAREFFVHLVNMLRLCKDVHRTQSIFSETLKGIYYDKAREQMVWLERHHAHELNKKLETLVKDIRWYPRWDAATADMGCRVLMAIAPNSASGRKAAEISTQMRRGLR